MSFGHKCGISTRNKDHCITVLLIYYPTFDINYIQFNKMTMKNRTEIEGSWNETKGKLKQKFAMLTDNDVLLVEGKRDEMLGRLQSKLGKTKEEMNKIISEL
jgi:uncharacterized protein YjbJ (UPF0337 family)